MRTPKEKRAGLTTATDLDTNLNCDSTASAASVNKWFTIWWYTRGFLSFDGCKAAFAAHPEWRAA
jgi:hypothetical protein